MSEHQYSYDPGKGGPGTFLMKTRVFTGSIMELILQISTSTINTRLINDSNRHGFWTCIPQNLILGPSHLVRLSDRVLVVKRP